MEQSKTQTLDSGSTADGRPTHSEDGVDLTLIRWMLSLTPRERLLTVQTYARSILEMRRANNIVS